MRVRGKGRVGVSSIYVRGLVIDVLIGLLIYVLMDVLMDVVDRVC